MAKWTINAYTFTSEGQSEPYTIGFYTADITENITSGKITITVDDTSKANFTIPYMQGKDLHPGQTLIDIKYGNDRKFFGTVVKKTYDSASGIYSFEVTGVLGTYKFMPNYDNYGVDTIENYLATEMSRFKGTASAPYADYNPWTELYTGHAEIPSTFGDIETENLSLIPAFNINLQKTANNAYDFIKLITRQKNYIIPQGVTPRYALHLFEKGEKVYFKRITQSNSQLVKYDDNLISYTHNKDTRAMRVYADNTVEGASPSRVSFWNGHFPVPFYYQRLTLSPKTNGDAYTGNEMADEEEKLVLANDKTGYEAYAFDKHFVDDSIPWLEMDKYVGVKLYIDGAETQTMMAITQITYDLCDATKSRIKLGSIYDTLVSAAEANEKDVQASLMDRLQTSGGEMTGDITYDQTENDIRNQYTIAGNEIHIKQTDESASSSARVIESAVDIVPLGVVPGFSDIPINNQPYVSATRKYGTSSATADKLTTTLNGTGFSSVERDSSDNFKKGTIINPDLFNLMGNPHRISASSNEIHMDDDRYVITANILDKGQIVQGNLDASGNLVPSATTRIATGYMPADASTTYTMSTESGFLFGNRQCFDANKTFLGAATTVSEVNNVLVLTTLPNTAFVRVVIHKSNASATITPSDVTQPQFEKGAKASPYKPFTMDATEVAERIDNIDNGYCRFEKFDGTKKIKITHQPSTYFCIKVFGFLANYGEVDMTLKCNNGNFTVTNNGASWSDSRLVFALSGDVLSMTVQAESMLMIMGA